MRIQTFSIVAGTTACQARCPFCVARLTPANGLTTKPGPINWRNFRKAARFAQMNHVTTVLITSKGENTLFPEQVTQYLEELRPYDFPITELQTNGERLLSLHQQGTLAEWYNLGLTTIAISVVHHNPEKNKSIYFPSRPAYFDLPATITCLKEIGFSVRLGAIMVKDYLDSTADVEAFCAFAKQHGADQITLRGVTNSDLNESDTSSWISAHALTSEQMNSIRVWFTEQGQLVSVLPHGGAVYDVRGQNVCLTNALTRDPDASNKELRQIIFFPDGSLRYDWELPGALIFGGWSTPR